ncbi:MAG: hypothetical protein ACK4N5_24100, partial [Myxococcales bacterium]
PGVLCTWAGTGESGFNGDGQPLLKSQLARPMDVAFDRGNTPFIVDFGNHRIRKVTTDGNLETLVGTDAAGDGDAEARERTAGGAWGNQVSLTHPTDVHITDKGMLVVTAWDNHKVRTLDLASGVLKVTAGSTMGFAGDGGKALDAKLNRPSKAVVNAKGELFILDTRNQRVRRVTAEAPFNITSPIGSGTRGITQEGKPPPEARFSFDVSDEATPNGGMALDQTGNMYIADTGAHRVYKIDFGKNTVTTFAGDGAAGYGGDGGPGTAAQLNGPRDLAIANSTLFIADTENHVVRAVDLGTGAIRTVIGNGSAGFSGDGGQATAAQLNRPHGVAIDTKGVLYVSDTFNNRIRRVKLQ